MKKKWMKIVQKEDKAPVFPIIDNFFFRLQFLTINNQQFWILMTHFQSSILMGRFLPTLFTKLGDGAIAGKHLILLSQPPPGAGIGTINSWKTAEANNFTGDCVAFSRVRHRKRAGPCWLLKLREMGTQGVQMKGVLPCLARWARCAGTRDFCPALAALFGPVLNIFPSPHTISIYLSPLPSKLGRQSWRVPFLA